MVFLLLYLFAKMGAGDLKLMVAIGAWLGYPLIFTIIIDVALVGGGSPQDAQIARVTTCAATEACPSGAVACWSRELAGLTTSRWRR